MGWANSQLDYVGDPALDDPTVDLIKPYESPCDRPGPLIRFWQLLFISKFLTLCTNLNKSVA